MMIRPALLLVTSVAGSWRDPPGALHLGAFPQVSAVSPAETSRQASAMVAEFLVSGLDAVAGRCPVVRRPVSR